MQVQFRTNLGSRDAFVYGLDYRECVYEAVVDMDETKALPLLDIGIVTPADGSTFVADPPAAEVKTTPPKPANKQPAEAKTAPKLVEDDDIEADDTPPDVPEEMTPDFKPKGK